MALSKEQGFEGSAGIIRQGCVDEKWGRAYKSLLVKADTYNQAANVQQCFTPESGDKNWAASDQCDVAESLDKGGMFGWFDINNDYIQLVLIPARAWPSA